MQKNTFDSNLAVLFTIPWERRQEFSWVQQMQQLGVQTQVYQVLCQYKSSATNVLITHTGHRRAPVTKAAPSTPSLLYFTLL